MANVVPDSFKTDLLKAKFSFDTSGNSGTAFKLALYTSISSYSASSTAYLAGTGNGEVSSSGTSYTAGGNVLTNSGVSVSSNIAFIDFSDLTFPSVTLTAAGAAIYKADQGLIAYSDERGRFEFEANQDKMALFVFGEN